MPLSITVYSLFALSLFLLGWHVNRREQMLVTTSQSKDLPFTSWEILLSIGIIALVFGFRFNTGSDYMMYWKQYYYHLHDLPYRRAGIGMEYGYELINRIFAFLKAHYIVYFAFWAGIQAFLIYYGLRHRKFLLPWMGLLLVLGPYSFNWLSFMRQWVVACAFVPMVFLIQQRRFLPYLLATVILSFIHMSALLLLLFYILPYKKVSELSRKSHFIVMLLMILLGLKPLWLLLFKPLLPLLPILGYDRYYAMFESLINGNFRSISWGILHLIVAFSQVIIIYYYKEVKTYRHGDKLLPIFFCLSFIAICFDNLFCNTIHFFLRPMDLLYICELVLLAYIYDFLFVKKRYIELFLCLAPVISYVFINVLKATLNPSSPMSNFVLYHFYMIR